MNERSDADAAAPRPRVRPVDPRLLRYARASRVFFAAVAVIAAGQAAAIVSFAWLVTRAVTGVIDGMPAEEVTATLAILAAVVAVRALLLWARETVASRAAARVQTELRTHLVEAVGELGPEWLGQRSTASLAVTAGRGLDALEAYFGRYLPQLVQTVVVTPLILLVMWWEDWLSGLTVLLTIPLIPLFMVLIGLATRAVQQKQWKTLQHLAARFSDTVQGLSTLKVYGRQHRAADSIAAVTERYRRETMKVLRVSFLSGFALEFLASISVAIVAVSIGLRLVDGSLALVVGLFVLLLAPEAYLPLRQVGVQFHAAAEGVAATEDVFEVLDAARTSTRRHAPGPATAEATTVAAAASEPSTPGLLLAAVRVRRGERLLDAVDLTAAPGTVTLAEGPSGAGKSSILAALRGAAAFEGTARWDGRDVRSLAPSAWLAWAGQQPGLVTGTVAANVAIGDDAPDAELVERALALACADGIRPDLALGVQGAGLSGGQAQRVAVARAFYRHLRGRAGLIALDEPSSALDAHTEDRLWQSVRSLADDGAAVLLVSHRESARRVADVVVRIGAREVVA
ncbi:thiol reductant ABC exporter subunit CydD [Microbacterium thalassium]|uniref:ATP-binding cassette subfamily C protein CydD n=1 Tax=Microbacterium thalassium TaxID=362649 RepID=A0A7X0KW12_9MICO|nr:thiol reductant ABC exporter subunit CydD [Microbacterium thalassium]MBB6392805.1 ATP-binding cassette subfamily C protein CydD [Microbacterium thalassium]GLK22964.1 hypothetical protein GCM10017607_02820 [Microbacterium thalassium]